MSDHALPTDLDAPEPYPPRLPAVTRLPVLIDGKRIDELDPASGEVIRSWRYDTAPYGAEKVERAG